MIRITVRLFSITVFLLISFLAIGQTSADYNKQARTANEKGDNDGIINAATLSLNVALNGEAYWWRAIGYKNKKNYHRHVPISIVNKKYQDECMNINIRERV